VQNWHAEAELPCMKENQREANSEGVIVLQWMSSPI